MHKRRLLQITSAFIIAAAVFSFPGLARADDDDDGTQLFSDSSAPISCASGGAGVTSCRLDISGWFCEVSCRTSYYGCCYLGSGGVRCVCIYNG